MPDRDPFAELPRLVGPESLTLVGGVVEADRVDALVEWLRSMPVASWWSFREWTDRMRLAAGLAGTGGDRIRFVWGRWFGEAGDLEVRREGPSFRWRWMGTPESRPPEQIARVDTDFFAASGSVPKPLLRPAEGTALLWDGADARVATADKETTLARLPLESGLQLRYVAYYDAGIVAAVRYRSIELVPAARTA